MSTEPHAGQAHMFNPDELVRSVLLGGTITAACGEARQVTRESFDAAQGLPGCRDCMDAAMVKHDEITVHSARGWLAFLERREMKRLRDRPVYTATITPQGYARYDDGQ